MKTKDQISRRKMLAAAVATTMALPAATALAHDEKSGLRLDTRRLLGLRRANRDEAIKEISEMLRRHYPKADNPHEPAEKVVGIAQSDWFEKETGSSRIRIEIDIDRDADGWRIRIRLRF